MNGLVECLILTPALIFQWCFGMAVARVLTGRPRRADEGSAVLAATSTELAGLGLALGIGFTSWLLFVWSWCGGTLGPKISWVLTGTGCLCGIAILIERQRHRVSPPHETSTNDAALGLICRRAILFLALVAIVQTLLTPQRFWDERAIFGLRAQVLFEARTVHDVEIKHPDFVLGHPRYPLLIPLAEEHIYSLLGHVDDRCSKLVFPLLYFGLVLCFAGVLMRHTSTGQAWLWALVLATVPALMPHDYGFLCGQADAPTGCFHGLSVLYLWDYWRSLNQASESPTGRWRSLVIAGLLAALAAFTKDEGIAFLMVDTCLVCGFVLLTQFVRRFSSRAGQLSPSVRATGVPSLLSPLLYIGAAAIILAPWFIYRRDLPLVGEMDYFGRMTVSKLVDATGTLNWLVVHLYHRMFGEWWEWGGQWWLVVAMCVLWPRRAASTPQLLLLGDLTGALAALIVAGMLAPIKLEDHIGGSSHRYLMQIAPVAILFVIGQQLASGALNADPSPSGPLAGSGQTR